MTKEIALSVKHLYKDFRLPHERRDSLKERVLNFRRKQSFEKLHILKDIDFEVKKGEFFGVVGRNGSGKSTLLKLIGGIYQPTKGSITVNGTLTPFIELGIGFNPELTGRENVFLNGAILGLTRKEVNEKYDEIVRFAELEKFMDQKLKNYSSGMQVRLAFSIAIRAHNDILLIDEVLAVGDMGFQEKCFEEFNKIKQSGKTVIFISHDLGSVQRFCDRVMIISNGEAVATGPADEIVLQYSNMVADQQFEQKHADATSVGTGKVRIVRSELLRGSSAEKHVAENEDFVIRTYFSADDPESVGEIVFGVTIRDHNDYPIIAPNTKENNFPIRGLPKEGYIDAKFNSNPLAPGKYSIVAGVFNSSTTITHDYVSDLLRFKVTGKARHGCTNIEPTWSVQDQS